MESRPDLLPGLDIYLTAYNELQSDRPVGMSVGAIPWSSIVKWGELHGFDLEEIITLTRFIRALEKEERA